MDAISELPVSAAPPSFLDTIETTAPSPLPTSYQEFRLQHDCGAFTAAVALYCHLDGIKDRHRAENIVICRTYAWFARNSESGLVTVISNSCRLRWCPICAGVRAAGIRQNVTDWLKTIRRPKFLTLTTRHSKAPLAEQIKKLYASFRLFRQKKTLRQRIRGGVWFFQLKRSKKSGEWHPHIHCVLDSDFIPKFELMMEWFQSTSGSFIIDIRKVEDERRTAEYVARYVSKPARLEEFTFEDQIELATVLHGKRLCGTFGSGGKCTFKPRPFKSNGEWIRISSWNNVVVGRQHDPKLQAILKAYMTNQPLAIENSKGFGPQPGLPMPDSNRWENELENGQSILQEFL